MLYSSQIIKRISVVIFILIFNFTFSQNNTHFKNLNRQDGLSNNFIRTIYQDGYGYMWFGTGNGLNRFDGNNFDQFSKFSTDKKALSGHYIHDILFTSERKLLVAHNHGVNIFNYQRESLSKFEPLSSVSVRRIVEGLNKNLWFVTRSNGVIKFNKDLSRDEDFSFSALIKEKFNISTSNLRVFKYDKGHFMVQIFNKGWYLFDLGTHEFSLQSEYKFPRRKIISKVLKVDSSEFWVASMEGIFVFKNGKLLKQLKEGSTNKELNNSYVHDLQKINKDEIWIFTDGGGINVYNLKSKRFKYIKQNARNDFSVSSNFLFSSYIARDGTLWVGSVKNGVSQLIQNNAFVTYKLRDLKNGVRSDYPVSSLFLDAKDRIWIGSDGNGLYRFNRGKINQVYYDNSIKTIPMIIDFDSDHLLLGTYRHGIQSYNLSNNKLTNQSELHRSLDSTLKVFGLFRDLNQDLIVSSSKTLKIERTTKKPNSLLKSKEVLLNRTVLSSYVDKENEFTLFGTQDGLYKLDNTGLNKITDVPKKVVSIYKFKNNEYWLATNLGICLLNIETLNTKYYSKESGYQAYGVNSMVKSNSGDLWVGSHFGVSKFNIESRKFTNYSYKNGFLDNEFVNPAVVKAKDGRLYFGGLKGILAFYPDQIKPFENPKKVIFTNISRNLNNEEHSESKKENVIGIDLLSKVTVEPDQNVFSIKYSDFEFSYPEKIQFQYKLEGFDDDWKSTSERSLTFMNLKPRTYFLQVKASNPQGDFNDEFSSLELQILPAWWQTVWFRVLIVLFVISIIIIINLSFLRRQKIKRNFEFEKESLHKQADLDNQHLRFFTNLSHEIRTPLTLILSPIEEILNKINVGSNIKPKLELAQKNAQRIKRLTNQAIDFRKNQFKEPELQAEYLNLTPFINEIIEDFSVAASNENISLKFQCDEAEIFIWFDAYMMDSILYNLVSNAIKYSSENNEVIISVEREVNEVSIKVRDFGKGISTKDVQHVFERFYQTGDHIGGSGIGLAITKKLVEAHSGTIEVQSKQGEGSCFEVKLKLGDDYISNALKKSKQKEQVSVPSVDQIETVDRIEETNFEKQNQTVLIVEDEKDLRTYLENYLMQFYNTVSAHNGVEALQVIKNKSIDLIISDVMMPEMDGFELCKRIKENSETSSIPIIMLTAKTQSKDRKEGYDIGADAYIEKPFQLDVILSRVKNLLESRTALKNKFLKLLDINIEEESISNSDKVFYERCMKIMESHIKNPEFDVNLFSQEIGMSRSILYKRMSKITDIGINDLMQQMRLNRAVQLLTHSNKSVQEITILTGFRSSKYFSTSFKKQFNDTPSNYRKSQRSIKNNLEN